MASGSERGFHRGAKRDGSIRGVENDIVAAHDLVRADATLELDAVCKAQRQRAMLERALRRHEPAVDRVAAFAVERLARCEVALRGRDDVAVPRDRRPGGLAAQSGRRNADAELEPDRVIRL